MSRDSAHRTAKPRLYATWVEGKGWKLLMRHAGGYVGTLSGYDRVFFRSYSKARRVIAALEEAI